MPSGFGYMSAGEGPAGLSESDDWADALDPFEGVRFIDPRVRDYALKSDGSFKRMGSTMQRVVLALITVRDSANGLFGFGLRLPEVLDQHYERTAKSRVREALLHLSDSIVINDIIVDVAGGSAGRSSITVDYQDVATGEQDRARI